MPFNESKALKVKKFIENLTYSKGEWAGKPFRLIPWQWEKVIYPGFGTMREDGFRQYRFIYVEIPKKSGKTELGGAIALYMLCADKEGKPEVYCLDPKTLILTTGLRWKELGNIVIGDELIGIDENPVVFGKRRKMRESMVIDIRRQKAEAYRVCFENDMEFISSGNHKWLAKYPNKGNFAGWFPVNKLQPGWRIRYFGKPWKEIDSWDSGYLAGIFDGEGSYHAPTKEGAAFRLCFAQKPGIVMGLTRRLLEKNGFRIGDERRHISNSTNYFNLNGLYDSLRFLGQIRPPRLFNNHKNTLVFL